MFKLFWGGFVNEKFVEVGNARVPLGADLGKEIEQWVEMTSGGEDFQIRIDNPLLTNHGQVVLTLHPIVDQYDKMVFEIIK